MPTPTLALIGLALSAVLLTAGVTMVRLSGAPVRVAQRLAGARGVRVGDLADLDPPPSRPLRVSGRIRCPDPIVTAGDDRLVALHRDVDVRLPDGRWRTLERIRETRGFELWDHDGSQPLDAADAAEPLVTIPHVWQGSPDELEDPGHRSAVDRLRQEGVPPTQARAVTRMVSVVDRLLVLAAVEATPAGPRLAPPPGGFVISTLDLPDAMRLLGGPRRSWLLAGAAIVLAGALMALASVVAALIG